MPGEESLPESAALQLPSQVGAYRVDGRLGAGGMGEVYRGWDEKLDRPVALKRVKPGTSNTERARKMFRREARAVARLHHSSIVQVFELVEDGDIIWLVMEFVEGQSLRDLCGGRKTEPMRVVEIGYGICTGLMAAHEAGIVHRDLKPDNVMLTPTGEVKILDFGIYKRLASEDDVSRITTVSAEGHPVGTVTAMSPEQAVGEEIDHRSDLFSLGSLLYELLTGKQPFRGGNSYETLSRICLYKEKPVHEVVEEVPELLSHFVSLLLEKDPAERPQSAEQARQTLAEIALEVSSEGPRLDPPTWTRRTRATHAMQSGALTWPETTVPTEPLPMPGDPAAHPTAGSGKQPVARASGRLSGWLADRLRGTVAMAAFVMVALAGLGIRQLNLVRPPTNPVYTAILETEIDAAPETLEARKLKAGAVHHGVLRALLSYEGFAPVEPVGGRAEQDLIDPAQVARALGADEAVRSRLECVEKICQIILQRIGAENGQVLWSHRFTEVSNDLVEISLSVADQLRGAYPDGRLRAGLPNLRVLPGDYKTYLEVARQVQLRSTSTSPEQWLDALVGLHDTSPNFLEPYVLEIQILRLRFVETRQASYLERARAVSETALALAPEDPRLLIAVFKLFLDAGQLDEAEAVLDDLLRFEPGAAGTFMLRALFAEARGDLEEAIRLMREAVRRQPSNRHHSNLASVAYRQGDLELARAQLELALERLPNDFEDLSRLAQLELLHGDLERAAELYESLVQRSPEETELTNLGVVYLLLERYDTAAESFRRALKKTPTSPFALLNLADAVLLRGDAAAAKTLYERTLVQIEKDPNPDPLRTVAAQALARLGRVEEAIAEVQAALRSAPDNPQVAYEAAVVYMVVGEETSATMQARRAVELGVELRWFDFVWFDPVRERIGTGSDIAPDS